MEGGGQWNWEVGELVEALGKLTTALCSEQGSETSHGVCAGSSMIGVVDAFLLDHARASFTAIAWFLCSLPAISHASRAFVVEHV